MAGPIDRDALAKVISDRLQGWGISLHHETGSAVSSLPYEQIIRKALQPSLEDELWHLLDGLAERHNWPPEMSQCECEWHEAWRVLKEREGRAV